MLRYRLDNQATAGTKALTGDLKDASKEAGALGGMITKLGAAAMSYVGIKGAYHAFIDFNKEVQNAKISLTAMVEGGFGGSFEYAKGQAESLYSEFQKFSQLTPVTTKEMLEFSRGVAVATQQAGGGISDIVSMTEQGVVAAKALGMESGYAARELAEMLSGQVSNRMLFAKQLIGLGGLNLEQFRALGEKERLAFTLKTLNSPAMKDATKQFSDSFSGVTSTLEDKMQILLGHIGKPLFEMVTKEIKSWSEWIDRNQLKIDHFAQSVSDGLVTAFKDVKAVFQFIYDHSDTLITIGKIWGAMKIGNMIGGGSGLSGMMGNLGKGTGALGFGSMIGPAMVAGMAGYELGNALGLDKVGSKIGDWAAHLTGRTDKMSDEFDSVTQRMVELDQAAHDASVTMNGIGADRTAASNLQGVIGDIDQQINVLRDSLRVDQFNPATMGEQNRAMFEAQKREDNADALAKIDALTPKLAPLQGQQDVSAMMTTGMMEALERTGLTDYQRQTLNEAKAANQIFGMINYKVSQGIPVNIGEVLKALRENTADPEGKHVSVTEKPKVNVTIHRIEVQSDDPDRMAFGMLKSFRDAAKNPSSALSALREG